jgi:hypothetical protein
VRTAGSLFPLPTNSQSVSSAANDSSAERFLALKDWSQKRQDVSSKNNGMLLLLFLQFLDFSLPFYRPAENPCASCQIGDSR